MGQRSYHTGLRNEKPKKKNINMKKNQQLKNKSRQAETKTEATVIYDMEDAVLGTTDPLGARNIVAVLRFPNTMHDGVKTQTRGATCLMGKV